jgi:hypothetical protein
VPAACSCSWNAVAAMRMRSRCALHPQEDQAQDGYCIIARDHHRTAVVLRQALAREQTEQCDERKSQPPERQPCATPYQDAEGSQAAEHASNGLQDGDGQEQGLDQAA